MWCPKCGARNENLLKSPLYRLRLWWALQQELARLKRAQIKLSQKDRYESK